MLIKCPECDLQVSDKATFCPHCGYPLQPDIKQRKPRSKNNKRRRLPNGFGQISEIKNRNLRNPFRAMVTVGKTSTGRPICKPLKPESYFPTYNDAYTALVEYNKNPYDLEPEEEALIGRYFKEEYDADFVFVTHYPSKKRPFYAMDDPSDEKFTLSFDLLFKGLEVTTGGQRIHDYQMLKDKIAARGMDEEGMEQYLDTFKHGMPPHGGLGIGLERLTMQILGEENVRETCLFPRDMNRLEP